ncbi:hypothetical protein D3C73_1601170 [compost metagenome]
MERLHIAALKDGYRKIRQWQDELGKSVAERRIALQVRKEEAGTQLLLFSQGKLFVLVQLI